MPSAEIQKYRKQLENNIENTGTPVEIQRKEWEDFALNVKLPENIKIKPLNIEGIHTEWISTGSALNKKIILYFHGGGYTTGSCITHRELASKIAISTGFTVVLLNYNLSPENKFPKAILDSEKVFNWICENHTNNDNIVFGGDSAGGGLALTTMLSLRDKKMQLPSAAFLISPWIDLSCTGESYKTRKKLDPMVTIESLKNCASDYLVPADLNLPLISPLGMDFNDLPPMLVQVGDHEILLSDSLRLAEKAKKFDIKIELKVWENMWHVWHAWNMPESDNAIKEIAAFLNDILS